MISIFVSWLGPGLDKSKYNLESSVTPKSLFEPVSLILFNASLNKALWASSLLSKKSIVSLTYLSSICLYKCSYTTFALCSDAMFDNKSVTKSPVTVT